MGEKIARLRQAGGAYRAACDLFINRLLVMDLVGEDTLTHSKYHPSRQNMVYRGQEGEERIEQDTAGAPQESGGGEELHRLQQ